MVTDVLHSNTNIHPHSHTPFFTVVIPTFQRPKTLKSAIDSVLSQDGFDDYAILVMDNDSTPDSETEQLVSEYQSHKLMYHKNPQNLGQILNWNRSIALASSEWLVLLHDDDALLPNYLMDVFNCIQKNSWIDGLFTMPLTRHQNATANQKQSFFRGIKDTLRTCYKNRYAGAVTQLTAWDYYTDCGYNAPIAALYRRSAVLEMDGFSEAWFPVSDWAFHSEFCKRYALCVLSVFGCIRGEGLGDSLKKEITTGFITKGIALRRTLKPAQTLFFGEWWIQTSGWYFMKTYYDLCTADLPPSTLDAKYGNTLFFVMYRVIVQLLSFFKRYYMQTEKIYNEEH